MNARDLILQLRSSGMSNRAIGAALNRNDSLISQIARGKKPGANLVDSLSALVQKRAGKDVPVPEPERRKTARGTTAKVRRKTKFAQGRTIKVKRQAVKSGAKSIANRIAEAAARGERIAFTVTYGPNARLSKSDGTPIPPDAKEQTTDVAGGGNGFPAAYWQQKITDAGGDVGAALSAWLVDANRLASPVAPIGIELRVWSGESSGAQRQAAGDAGRGYV